jgi:hypothetical protein
MKMQVLTNSESHHTIANWRLESWKILGAIRIVNIRHSQATI